MTKNKRAGPTQSHLGRANELTYDPAVIIVSACRLPDCISLVGFCKYTLVSDKLLCCRLVGTNQTMHSTGTLRFLDKQG